MANLIKNDHIDENIYCHRSLRDPGYRVLDRDFHAYGITIPKGFRWNGASAPRIFSWLVPRFDHSLISSCVHDFLCAIAKTKKERAEADKIYKRLLIEAEGFPEFKAEWAYRGVRLGAFWGTGVSYPHIVRDYVWPILGIQ